jgi:hypothetical protein
MRRTHVRGLLIARLGFEARARASRKHSAHAERILPQTMFQFLNKLRKPYRSRRIRRCPRQSAAQIELLFELLSVALLIHDGTPLATRRRNRSIKETACRSNIFPRFRRSIRCRPPTSPEARSLGGGRTSNPNLGGCPNHHQLAKLSMSGNQTARCRDFLDPCSGKKLSERNGEGLRSRAGPLRSPRA